MRSVLVIDKSLCLYPTSAILERSKLDARAGHSSLSCKGTVSKQQGPTIASSAVQDTESRVPNRYAAARYSLTSLVVSIWLELKEDLWSVGGH